MIQEKFAISLQQDLITLLVHDDKHGKTVAKTVSSLLFEGDYRTIVDRALPFWQQYGVAPKQHVADLLSDILEDKRDRRAQTFTRILVQMMEMKDQINTEFVLRSMTQFIRHQQFKSVIVEAAEILDAEGIHGNGNAEVLISKFLRDRDITLDRGIRLSEIDRVLEFLSTSQNEFKTGIRVLDEANIVPMRGKIYFILAPTGLGKTWFLIEVGKMAYLQRKKIVHISLEIESEEVIQRYYQALFGVTKRDDLNKITTLKLDRKGNLDQFVSQTVEVPFTFSSPAIREELNTRIKHFGTRAENLIVKRFPMRSLTMNQLEAYLESLEALDNFVPDMVILDYPGIMKTDEKNLRISLGTLIEDLRGLSQRRNFALVAAHQGNRESASAELVRATHASEAWSVIGSADFVLTYSQTAAEKALGLARLFVDKARSESDKFGVLITQTYKAGQFVLESIRLDDSYAKLLEQMHDDDSGDGSDDAD